VYCGRHPPEIELVVDHITPWSKDGAGDAPNLVSACRDCNAGKGANRVPPTLARLLIGKFFHTFDAEGYVNKQGRFAACIEPNGYLVEYFEWFTGSFNGRYLIQADAPIKGGWAIYDTDEAMRDAYEYGSVKRKTA